MAVSFIGGRIRGKSLINYITQLKIIFTNNLDQSKFSNRIYTDLKNDPNVNNKKRKSVDPLETVISGKESVRSNCEMRIFENFKIFFFTLKKKTDLNKRFFFNLIAQKSINGC